LATLWAKVRLRSDFLQSLGKVTQPTRHYAKRAPADHLQFVLVVGTHQRQAAEVTALKKIVPAFVSGIAEALPDAKREFALVHYRDQGEEYVVRDANFTADTGHFARAVGGLRAEGRGDEPESVAKAFSSVRERLSWHPKARKIVLWVTGAPPRESQWREAQRILGLLGDEGVEVYPLATSDTSLSAEYFLRWSAARTSGRFLFLTDDGSTVGTTREPWVPCFVVKELVGLVTELVTRRMKGLVDVDANEGVVRRTGRFDDGLRCAKLD
jgi:hypothetical protein